jgi:methylmalonyl-CoA/ethylmalonyl-CoA epimerase
VVSGDWVTDLQVSTLNDKTCVDESAGILGVHHIGVVVDDIAAAGEIYCRRYGYEPRSPVIHDRTQTVFVQFFRLPGDQVYLELVQPDSDRSKVARALSQGGGLNHICYITSDIDAACRRLRAQKMVLLQAPVAAEAFPGRRIAWLMGGDRIPIELVERGDPGQL